MRLDLSVGSDVSECPLCKCVFGLFEFVLDITASRTTHRVELLLWLFSAHIDRFEYARARLVCLSGFRVSFAKKGVQRRHIRLWDNDL